MVTSQALRWSIGGGMRRLMRKPVSNGIFAPHQVDWESHPYHPGWMLHTWLRE